MPQDSPGQNINPYQSPELPPAMPSKLGPPAGFWIRALAMIVDGLCLAPLSVLSLYAVYNIKSLPLFLAVSIPGFFYKPLLEAFFGGTLGKLLCGLRVTTEQGGNIGILQSYLRFSPWLPQAVMGFVLVLWLFNQPAFPAAEGFLETAEILQQNPVATFANLLSWITIIDCVFVATNDRKQAGHDMLAKTYCVYIL